MIIPFASAAAPLSSLADRLGGPELLAGAAALALLAAVGVGLALSGRRRARAEAAEMRRAVEALAAGQERLSGGLQAVAEASDRARAETQAAVDGRLGDLGERLGARLGASAETTAAALGALTQRLEAIDRAQENIEKLSGDVLGLQAILRNKQTRGAFGEIQLMDIVSNALPPNAYRAQAALSNGKRVDALLLLPDPPGPIGVDAKFPLEPYERLRDAETPAAKAEAQRAFRQAVRAHVAAIAEKYVLPGETAEGALMFLPSEAVYAELHANFAELVREGFEKRVWVVSPTTLMATLATMRAILRDAALRAEAGDLRRELGLLRGDVARLAERAEKLAGHFQQAEGDVRLVATSAEKTLRRLERLERGDDLGGDLAGGAS